MSKQKKNRSLTTWKQLVILGVLVLATVLSGCTGIQVESGNPGAVSASLSEIPAYSDSPYVVIDDNVPAFSEEDKQSTEPFETYSPLDSLERCGVAYANICQELMPTESRGEIGHIHPTGWQSVRYDFVDGKSLYNRCHLIGFQLAGENANDRNLVTGTRYMNVQGMLPFENMIADYVKETNNHVLYRVTPIFEGDELVCRGVQMEAWSVEDEGDGVAFNVFCYNVQPGVEIDYATGDSWAAEEDGSTGEKQNFVLNTSSKKFHRPDCSAASSMSKENRKEVSSTREALIREGYEPCGSCKP